MKDLTRTVLLEALHAVGEDESVDTFDKAFSELCGYVVAHSDTEAGRDDELAAAFGRLQSQVIERRHRSTLQVAADVKPARRRFWSLGRPTF